MPNLLRALDNDRSLKAQLLAAYPELADDDELLCGTLDSVSDLDEQIHAVLRVAIEREANATALEEIIKKLQGRKARLEDGADRMKAVCLHIMQEAGRKRFDFPDMTVTTPMGRPGVVITDEAALPEEFVKVERAPKKKEIGDALRAGQKVRGAELRNARPHLIVRMG